MVVVVLLKAAKNCNDTPHVTGGEAHL